MERREFLKLFTVGIPALALPNAAVSLHALNTSNQAKRKVDSIILTTEGALINNCNFQIHGDFCLNGSHQTINHCHFQMENSQYGIKVKNS